MHDGELSDTSAFVTILAGRGIHTSPSSLAYLDMLDLSPGKELIRRCLQVWPHLDQLVKNRKKCILDEVLEHLAGDVRQVVILGSGMDPLSLEIISRVPDAVVYELDWDNMDSKRRLLDAAVPENRIKCITANLGSPAEAVAGAVAAGWKPGVPSILVLEGISYYLEKFALLDLIRKFCAHSENHVIMEYVVPSGFIDADRAFIPDKVFGVIADYLSDPLKVSLLDPDNVRDIASGVGGRILRRHTMRAMEMARTGINQYFPTDSSGWVEICTMVTQPPK